MISLDPVRNRCTAGDHTALSNTEIKYTQKLYELHLHFPTTVIERRRDGPRQTQVSQPELPDSAGP
jgi:hypothetical protein